MNVKSVFRRLVYHFVAFYGVSKSEAIGFTILIPVLFIVISTPLWFKYLFPVDDALDERSLREFKQWIAEAEASVVKESPVTERPLSSKEIDYHQFDPNTSTSEELISLGFKPWVAERIVKYRNAGARFRSTKDLEKIYGISKDHLDKVADYVKITVVKDLRVSETIGNRKELSRSPQPKIEPKNLNAAIAVDFAQVRGIGPVLSERIVKYREMLGGFSELDQIDEVYGLDKVVADSAKRYFFLDTVKVQRLDINHLKKEELRKHPYISYKLANAIQEYRIQHGDYINTEDLLQIKILDDSTFQKILPYLKLD